MKRKVTLLLLLCSVMLTSCGSVKDTENVNTENAENVDIDNNQRIEDLEKRIDELEEKVAKLEYAESTDESTNLSSADSSNDFEKPVSLAPRTLGNGTYVVGTDITAGKYDLEARRGYGKIKGDFASGFLSMGFGISDRYPENRTYSGLVLTDGDEFEISNGVSINFIPVYQ